MTDTFDDGRPSAWAATPRKVRWAARVLWCAIFALPPALLLVPWQQTVRGKGRVIAYAPLDRRQRIEAPIDGRVVRWWVVEGSPVRKGDDLFEITDNDPRLIERLQGQLSAAQAKLSAAEAKLQSYTEQITAYEESRRFSLLAAQERIDMSTQRILANELSVRAAEVAQETARLNFERRAELRQDGLASGRDWELANLEVRKSEAELQSAGAALAAARSDKQALEADKQRITADFEARITSARADQQSAASEAASARSAVLELEVRVARQETQRVVAPVDGTVLRLFANQGGEMVKHGDPIVELVPEAEAMAVELWVDGNDMPLLSTDRHVRLQFEGWPAVQFAGWPSIAIGTFGGIVRLIDATDDGLGRFRILVVPDPDDQPWPSRRFLRQGVQSRGWIWLGRVTLGFELWRLFNGFPPVIAPNEPTDPQK